jgi:hypothetical protein
MDARTIISDDMSLEEKLAAIDAAMATAVANAQQVTTNGVAAPVDPADLTMCMGCQ